MFKIQGNLFTISKGLTQKFRSPLAHQEGKSYTEVLSDAHSNVTQQMH